MVSIIWSVSWNYISRISLTSSFDASFIASFIIASEFKLLPKTSATNENEQCQSSFKGKFACRWRDLSSPVQACLREMKTRFWIMTWPLKHADSRFITLQFLPKRHMLWFFFFRKMPIIPICNCKLVVQFSFRMEHSEWRGKKWMNTNLPSSISKTKMSFFNKKFHVR